MAQQYKYTLLRQDGVRQRIASGGKRLSLNKMYEILKCSTIELIPRAYYDGTCTMYGDEEARFSDDNKRNPFFKVLSDGEHSEYDFDVVGNVIKEERV